ncbi:MAG: peptidylprolyl isomerase [Phycisphaerae bacterium]|nr:peptidylprolyl isomerase [Phycisphaerae bacterium]
MAKQALIRTNLGDMRVKFFPDKAPNHVENFLELAESGFYRGLRFHRIIRGFVIQGGCPRGDGTGNGPRRLRAEFNDVKHVRGVLSMARANDPNSASCQFFICLDECPNLDGLYTAFGTLIDAESFETLSRIESVPVRDNGYGEHSAPTEPVEIESVVVETVPN